MKLILENWKRFLQETEERAARPPYTLPISLDELLAKVMNFISANSPKPKGAALKMKKRLLQKGRICDPTFGLCFDAATLMQHMAGGKHHSGLIKRGSTKVPIGPKEPKEISSHWWLEKKPQRKDDKETKIYDPTADQFTFGAPPPYSAARAGASDFGWPYFDSKGPRYSETVPSKAVLGFAKDFKQWNREQHGEDTAYGMDWWLEEINK